MESILFKAALALYLVSAVGFVASLLTRRVFLARLSTWCYGFTFVLHTSFILWRWTASGYSPVVNLFEALSFVAWGLTGTYLIFQLVTKTRVLGAFVSPLALVLFIAASAGITGAGETDASVKNYWVAVHAVFSLTGNALFALACCAALMYLVQDRLIRKRKIHDLYRVLPSLGDLDRINHISVIWGFSLLTVGIVAGSLWARVVWGSHLLWDAKQIATLGSWILCALLVHQRVAIGWKGKRAAYLSIGAFAVLFFSFLGVHLFFPTIHRF